jgi:hypothetical protein
MKKVQFLLHPFWAITTHTCPENTLIWVGMLALRNLVNQNVDQKLSGVRKQFSFCPGG